MIEALAPLAPVPKQAEMELPAPAPSEESKSLRDISELHRRIMDRISQAPVAEDHLIRDMKMPTHLTSSALVDLELAGRIARTAGGLLTRN